VCLAHDWCSTLVRGSAHTKSGPRGQIWDFDWDADGQRLAVARGKTSTDIVLYRGLNASK
jgi:YD repeat-containing protein